MEKLQLNDFLYYNYLSGLESSPNEDKVAFIVHRADIDTNNYKSYIWIMDCESKDYFQLTGLGEESNFQWLDDENIIFSTIRNEQLKKRIEEGEEWTCYYKISTKGGEACEYMRIPLNVTSLKVIDRNKFLISANYSNYGIKLNGLVGEERASAIALIKENKDYEVLDEIPFWGNGKGFTNKKEIDCLYMTEKKMRFHQ